MCLGAVDVYCLDAYFISSAFALNMYPCAIEDFNLNFDESCFYLYDLNRCYAYN